jgi:signal transduction histidine kinase/ActR/RegA family two-component response regulator
MSPVPGLDPARQASGSSDTQPSPLTGPVPRLGGRPWFRLRLHHLLFIAFTIIAGAPIAVLAWWEGNTAFQNELDSVRERHLLVARNLTSTMSRYVKDVEAVFGLTFESGALNHPVAGLTDLLTSLNVIHVGIVAPDGGMEVTLPGLSSEPQGDLPAPLLADLRTLAANAHGQIAISNLYHDKTGRPVFYLVRQLPTGRLGVGVVTTSYLVSLQQAIAFGDHGHAVMVDARGQVIAHPFKDWVAASRDVSGVPVVAAMMRGETGVGQFYSPAFNGNMIAGYAVVPETGWGVMVPQPIAELRSRADQVNQMATVIAVAAFAGAALMAWLLALYLARPMRSVAATADAVLNGNDEVAVPQFHGLVPSEIRRLGAAFNTMLDGLRGRAAETRHALRQAETSNAAKSQFLANMSHEIRTPLNGVVGMVELMQLTDLSPSQRRYVETATQSSQTLLRLIDDILDLSRIEVGRLELDRAPFHLPSLVHDLRVLFVDQARAKGLTLLTSVPDSLNVMLLGDKHRLLQVLTNLVGNALKFTAEGTVTLQASAERDTGSTLRLRFEVSDSGIGIPVNKQEMIFEAFAQADSTTTRRYGGTGLGLSIARELCHMMGGEIGVQSTVGLGSTFWFTVRMEHKADAAPAMQGNAVPAMQGNAVPAMQGNAAPAMQGNAAPAMQGNAAPAMQGNAAPAMQGNAAPAMRTMPSATSARPVPVATVHPFVSPAGRDFRSALERAGRNAASILLVEDNPANMRVTQALLETLGCRVTPARNGLEAVGIYRDNRFDLLLMDCQMPEMDGYEATRAIRQLEGFQGRRTPIIALTAHAMEGSREASMASGMDDQITKPLTMATLTAKLLEWLTPAEAPLP